VFRQGGATVGPISFLPKAPFISIDIPKAALPPDTSDLQDLINRRNAEIDLYKQLLKTQARMEGDPKCDYLRLRGFQKWVTEQLGKDINALRNQINNLADALHQPNFKIDNGYIKTPGSTWIDGLVGPT
jgi:hypothetical protein